MMIGQMHEKDLTRLYEVLKDSAWVLKLKIQSNKEEALLIGSLFQFHCKLLPHLYDSCLNQPKVSYQ